MAGHVLRPSGSDRWGPCGAAYEAEEAFPELSTSDKAREGDAAHHYVANSLRGQVMPVGSSAPNGWPIDAEMIEAAQVYLDYCRELMAQASPTALIRVETAVTMHRLIHPLNQGTPDFFLADAGRKLIVVPDFKYGHRPVPAYRRLQLVDYAAGVCEALELTAEDVRDWEVRLVIVQPRNYRATNGPVDEWVITGAHLFEWIEWLSARAHNATSPNPLAETGPHCHDCSARIHCSAFQALGGGAMELAREGFTADLPNDALAVQLRLVRRALKALEAMETGLEELAVSRVKQGARIPGWGMKTEKGSQQWNDPAEALRLGQALGFDFRKPPMVSTVVTPSQALKLGVPAEVVDVYATRKTSVKLTEQDETAALRAFSK